MADNTVTVIGNITRDPELRYTASGQALATFGLASNRVWTNRQTGAKEESTSFFDIACWGSLAENIADSLGKGNRVIVTGRLDQRSWETQDGEKRSKVEIVADEVGPSLRWATARPARSESRNGQAGGGQGGQQGGPQGGQQGGYNAPQGGGGYAPAPAAPAYDDNEEPF